MKTYRIEVVETITAIYEVEAKSKADALNRFAADGEFLFNRGDLCLDEETAKIVKE